MCGTVAWLRKRRDDEQFDLAAWFLSLEYSWARVASFLYFSIFGNGSEGNIIPDVLAYHYKGTNDFSLYGCKKLKKR